MWNNIGKIYQNFLVIAWGQEEEYIADVNVFKYTWLILTEQKCEQNRLIFGPGKRFWLFSMQKCKWYLNNFHANWGRWIC